jgi:FimV-like protein
LPGAPGVLAQPAPVAASASAAASASSGGPTALPATRLTVRNDSVWTLAGTLLPGRAVSRAQVMVALLRANPEAFVGGNLHRLRENALLTIPSLAAMQAEPANAAAALIDAHLVALTGNRPVGPLPTLGAVPAAPTAPAVPPAPAPAQTPAPAPVAPPPVAPVASAPAVTPPALPASAVVAPTAPSAESASTPTPAPEPAAASAADAASLPRPAVSGDPGPARWFPYAMLVVLVGAAAVLWLRRRPSKRPADALPSTFIDEQGVTRRRRPKVLDVSQAAADMARTVETLQPAAALVSSDASAAPVASAAAVSADLRQQAALKLDLARACMEVGRNHAARALLLAVGVEGALDQQADAGELLARLG